MKRLGVTVNGIVLLALAVIGWLIGQRLASRPVLVMVYGLVLLLALAWILGRRRVLLEVGRSSLPGRVRENQNVEVELTFRPKRRITTIVLEETLPEQLGGSVRFPVSALPKGQEVTHSYSFSPRRRGKYVVGPLVAEWNDPFGLTRRRVLLDEPVPLIVHPSTEMVNDRVISRAWEDPPIRPPVFKPWPTGFEFYGLRDYVSGDDPRRIVWRATARTLDLETGTGRYLVREAEQGITDRVNVFLDTDRGSHSPGEISDTFELGVRAAASLGVKHLQDGFGVTVNTNAAPLASNLRGRRTQVELLDHLAGVEREGIKLSSALERLMLDRQGRSHNVVITPHLDRDSATRLRIVLDRGTSVLLALLIWEDTDPVTIHRAGTLGCSVVELTTGTSLAKVFMNALGGRR